LWLNGSGQLYFEYSAGTAVTGSGVVPLNTWTYVTVVADASIKFYLNGALDSTLSYAGHMTADSNPLQLGNFGQFNGGIYQFNGSLDEVRISSLSQSSNWVWACYMSQASNTTFNTYGVAQSAVAGSPVIANAGAGNVQQATADMIGNLTTGSAPVTVICYWGPSDGGAAPGAWANTNSLGMPALGYITNSVTGLTPGQPYYFRYYATNSAADCWATPAVVFTTPGAPTVDNAGGATPVGQTSATLNGTQDGGYPNPNVWIYWGTTDGGTTKGAWNLTPIGLGPLSLGGFSTNVSGLLASQQYWYRCYASNSFNDAWATASTNFTTAMPNLTVTPVNGGLVQGTNGTTTNITYTVSISATSAVAVSVGYATSNGTATAAANGYVPASGTLTIPAGQVTGSITVSLLGTNVYLPVATFYVNFSNAVNTMLVTTQVTCTITNNNTTFYVRGDGLGNDTTHGGTAWNDAFATLANALALVPFNTPFTINVQASTGSQSYAACSRTAPYNGYYPLEGLNTAFQGGWMNVDGTPSQTGMSAVTDVATNHPGIQLSGNNHNEPFQVSINRFAFSNVTYGVELTSLSVGNNCGLLLIVSNTTVRAKNDGLYLSYPQPYGASFGLSQVMAENVSITAGLGGAGNGVTIVGAWTGSAIRGTDTNVTSITSANGCGVYFSAIASDAQAATFSNTVIYGCASNGIHLDAALPIYTGATGSNRVQAILAHCTITDNAGDGVNLVSLVSPSWTSVTNCIFANNSGHGVNFAGGPVFTCPENYNVFFNNNIYTNGVAQTVGSHTSTADPLFYAQRTKPAPWYQLGSKSSPAYHSGSDTLDRGAYLTEQIAAGIIVFFR
jgi:hypothetical protein